MGNPILQPRWTKVLYSKKKIEKAGKDIISSMLSDDDRDNALAVIDNWRAAHAYPLQIIYMNLKRLAGSNRGIIVAQRLKRLDSIVGKLRRFSTMSLWKMVSVKRSASDYKHLPPQRIELWGQMLFCLPGIEGNQY